jgi:hypothetical protein
MNRVSAVAMLSVLFAPALAQACPAAGCAACGGSSLSYLAAFGGGALAGILSIALQRRRS